MKKTILAAAITCSLLLTGCASIVSDSSYPVSIRSAPDGALFTITNKSGAVIHTGTTPAIVTLKSGAGFFSGETYKITMKKPGYAPKVVTLDSTLDDWYLGNIVFYVGGLPGMLIVDPSTGAMWKLPETISADLGQKIAGSPLEKGQLQIVSINQIPDQIKPSLQPLKK